MSKIDALVGSLPQEDGDAPHSRSLVQPGQPSASPVLRVISPPGELSSDLPAARRSPSQDWSELVDRVRMTANRIRELKADAEDQEIHVRDLLEKVREDIKAANDRMQTAEAHALDVQKRAGALVAAAEERAKAAEERARTAESWLLLVKKAFTEEFDRSKTENRPA